MTNYWKIKALVLSVQALRTQAEAAVTKAEQAVKDALAESGLDPNVAYSMDDAAETLTPVESRQP
jgi:hypothetical protein